MSRLALGAILAAAAVAVEPPSYRPVADRRYVDPLTPEQRQAKKAERKRQRKRQRKARKAARR